MVDLDRDPVSLDGGDDGRADLAADHAGLERLSDFPMQDLQDVFRPLSAENRGSSGDFTRLEKYPVH